MEVTTLLYWRSRGIVDFSEGPTIKRFDTTPEIGARLTASGEPISITGSVIVGRMRFTVTLVDRLVPRIRQVRVAPDQFFRLAAGQVLILNSERLLIQRVDNLSDLGFTQLQVLRAQTGPKGPTEEAVHEAGTVGSVMVIERPGKQIPGSELFNDCYLPWQSSADTSKSGAYDVEFEITDGTGQSFSTPTGGVVLTIVDDFDGA